MEGKKCPNGIDDILVALERISYIHPRRSIKELYAMMTEECKSYKKEWRSVHRYMRNDLMNAKLTNI